jgi:hypothetical protein
MGVFDPLEASPDPLTESLCSGSLGNCYINSVWTPLTLGPCGPQASTAMMYDLAEPVRAGLVPLPV